MKGPKDRKEQILHEAARLFKKRGYNATTVRMIAAQMKMEASSLYNHISSKQEILRELLFQMANLFTQGMKNIEASQTNPYEKLEQLVALHVRLTMEYPDQISLITGEWIHLESPELQHYTTLRNDYEQRFKHIIKSGIEEGFLEKTDVDLALFSILSTLHWLYSWIGRHREIPKESLEAELKQTLLLGIRKR